MTTPNVLPAFSAVALDHVVQILQAGEVVVVPTDTVYGLAAALDHPEAVAHLYEVKRRPADRPIALLVDRIEDVDAVAAQVPLAARRLMEHFWPRGLTLVLPRRPEIPDIVTAGGPNVAVRMPDHPVPRALIRRLGAPLPTTSANRSGSPSALSAQQALADLGEDVPVFLDAGPAPGGVESTVIDVTTSPPTVLRVGAVSIEALENALGYPVQVKGS